MSAKKKREFKVVGHSVDKVDALGLACGRGVFTDDIHIPHLLHAVILKSPHPHAIIKKIDTSAAEKVPGLVCILTHKDVPRVAHTTAGQGYPEPSPYDTFCLDKKVRFVGDRVAAVAAETPEAAEEACRKIKVDYKILPAVLDPLDAMKKGAPVIHDEKEARVIIPIAYDKKKNLAGHVDTTVGDVEKGFKKADFVIEAEYESHYAQHCPLEPHITITWLDDKNRLTIRTSTQVPFHVRRIVAERLQIPIHRIRVIKPRIGGGFGAKQEVLLEDICSALTLKTGRPVKLEFTRAEEFYAGRTRHPQIIWLKTGVKKDGTITAIDLKILMNTGAYGSHALTVVCNSGSKVLPLYRCKDVSFWGDTVYTNLPVGGAYRGYGATQTYFAMESQMDMMADAIGMDPLKFRQMNHIKSGEGSPIFEALGEGKAGVEQKIGSCGLPECITLGAKEIDWKKKRKPTASSTGVKRRGLGMCILMQGSSIPEIDMGAATIKMNDDGSFNLLVGATDLGTGSDTVLSQIAAEELGVGIDQIIVHSSDTDLTPFDVGAYASSTTYLSGMAAQKAAAAVKEQILKVAGEMLNAAPDKLKVADGTIVAPNGKKKTFRDVAFRSLYEKDQHQICATESHISHKSPPPFSAHFAEVEVDMETGQVTVIKYVGATDCGTAINPNLAEGQVEGAMLNGIGFAMTEEFIFDNRGRVTNASFMHYKIPSTTDLPDLKAIMVPTYEETGPYGAKSVSEIGINGPLPAIGNAIYNATGARLYKGPFTPERVLAAIKALNEERLS